MTRLLFALCALAASLSVHAQQWPARPVKIIAPFAPGGSADTLGRIVAKNLSEQLKESFVVENRPGAGGVLGSEIVSNAAPDGYTLVVSGIASHVIAPQLPQGTPYDPMKDFTHVALLGGPPAVLAVNPKLPAKTPKEVVELAKHNTMAPPRPLKELVGLAKQKPMSYGSPGNGTQGQLVAELFKQKAGIDLQHVPYKGASAAVTDLMGGQIESVSTTLSTAAGQIKAGKARALAISAAHRLEEYPNVPTFAESGYPDLIATVWFSISGPKGLPDDIVQKLNAEIRRAMETTEVRDRLKNDGITPNRLDAKEFTAYVADELRRWGPIVRNSGAKND